MRSAAGRGTAFALTAVSRGYAKGGGTASNVRGKGALLPHRAARGTAAIQRAAAVKTKIFSFSRIKFLKKSAISATIYKSAIETQI